MLKSITAFLIADKQTKDLLSRLEVHVTDPTIVDPAATAWATMGFHAPDNFGGSPIYVGQGNTRLFCVQTRERILPSGVIKAKTVEAIKDCEERQGHKVGRKQAAEIKERVVMELLPKSHIRHVNVMCMVTGNYLLIGTTSANKIDRILEMLIGSYDVGPLQFLPLTHNRDCSAYLRNLLNETTDSGTINCGRAVVMKGEGKQVARFKDIPLESEPVVEAVADGLLPVEIQAVIPERVQFNLTNQGVLKSIAFADIRPEDEESEAGLDSDLFLYSNEFKRLLDTLRAEMPEVEEEL